jgi:hypothetical protein
MRVRNLLPRNNRCLQSYYIATFLNATVFRIRVLSQLYKPTGDEGAWGVETQLKLFVSSSQGYGEAFHVRTRHRYPLNRRLGGLTRRSGYRAGENNILPLLGVERRYLVCAVPTLERSTDVPRLANMASISSSFPFVNQAYIYVFLEPLS